MSRSGQILLEVLVAAILLVVLIPHIPALCWKYAGPDWTAYTAMVAENNAIIALNEQKAKLADLRVQLAALDLKRGQYARIAAAQSQHEQAMSVLEDFTTGQSNAWADCLIKAEPRQLSQSEKDKLILTIWHRANYSCGNAR